MSTDVLYWNRQHVTLLVACVLLTSCVDVVLGGITLLEASVESTPRINHISFGCPRGACTLVVWNPTTLPLGGMDFSPAGSYLAVLPSDTINTQHLMLNATAVPPRLLGTDGGPRKLMHPLKFDLVFVDEGSGLHAWRPQPRDDYYPVGDVFTHGSTPPDVNSVWLLPATCLDEFPGYNVKIGNDCQNVLVDYTPSSQSHYIVRACETLHSSQGALGTAWVTHRAPDQCALDIPKFCPLPSCLKPPGKEEARDTSADQYCLHGVARFVEFCAPLLDASWQTLQDQGGSRKDKRIGQYDVKAVGVRLRLALRSKLKGCYVSAVQLFGPEYDKRCATRQSVRDHLVRVLGNDWDIAFVLDVMEVASNVQLLRWPLNQMYLNPPLATYAHDSLADDDTLESIRSSQKEAKQQLVRAAQGTHAEDDSNDDDDDMAAGGGGAGLAAKSVQESDAERSSQKSAAGSQAPADGQARERKKARKKRVKSKHPLLEMVQIDSGGQVPEGGGRGSEGGGRTGNGEGSSKETAGQEHPVIPVVGRNGNDEVSRTDGQMDRRQIHSEEAQPQPTDDESLLAEGQAQEVLAHDADTIQTRDGGVSDTAMQPPDKGFMSESQDDNGDDEDNDEQPTKGMLPRIKVKLDAGPLTNWQEQQQLQGIAEPDSQQEEVGAQAKEDMTHQTRQQDGQHLPAAGATEQVQPEQADALQQSVPDSKPQKTGLAALLPQGDDDDDDDDEHEAGIPVKSDDHSPDVDADDVDD